jgi:hypothetical protein
MTRRVESLDRDDPYLALRERVTQGERAQRLLGDPTLENVLDQVEADAINHWRMAHGPSGLSTREAAHALLTGVDAIRNQLRVLFDDGEIARAELAELTDMEERS